MRAEVRRRRGVNRRVGAGMVAVALACASVAVGASSMLETPASASSAPGRPFAPVLERLVLGDLVVAANTNVIAAGGRGARPVDIDGERELSCVLAQPAPVCEDNSSSAPLDVPPGARVVEARLYVETSMPIESNPMEVLLDGPAEGFDYVELSDATAGVPKVYEARGTGEHGSLLQAVWDVTEYVGAGGAGTYTVADIPNERTALWQPFASWAIVAVYELDPGADLAAMTLAQRARFAPRSVSWSDGFAVAADGPVSVTLDGLVVPDVTPFAKSVHVIASSRQGAVDNLLYDGQPVGNNHHAPGAPPVPGVVIGSDPTCNTVTDVFNDTICVLGTPVADKYPALVNSGSDGTARTSGAAVDIDVVRVPGHYVRPNQSAARMTVRTTGDQSAAVGVLALSVDVPPAHALALTVAGGQRPSAAEVAALEAESAPPTTAAAATTTTPSTSSTTSTTPVSTQPEVERRFASALVPEPIAPGDTTVTGTTTTTTVPDTVVATAPPLPEPTPTDPPATAAPTEPPPTEPPATPPPATDPPVTDPPVTSAPSGSAPPTTVVATPTTVPTPTTVAATPPGGAPTTTVATAVDPGTVVTTTTVVSSTIPDPDGDPITDPVEEPAETPSGRVVVAAGAIDAGVQRTISFPVAGPVIYGNDWGACRDGCARAHKGVDIIGDRLQPILAMTDGVVDHLIDHRTAGYGVAIRDAEGWQYHVYHVNNDRPGTDDGADDGTWRFAPGIADGAPVRAGQVIAWMGDSGNSEYSVPHAHVEIHRPDGTAVNPYWSLRLSQRRATCAAELAAAAEEDGAASGGAADADEVAAATDAGADEDQTATDEAAATTTTTTIAPTTTTTVPAPSVDADPTAAPTAEEIEREREEAEAWLSAEWKDPANVPDGWLPLELTGGRPTTDNLAARMWLRSSDFIPVDAPALIVGDPRYEADVNCDDPEADIAPAIPAELGAILATIRQMESGGDYSAQARTSSASGAYQFVDGTWGNYGGYARAVLAPPAVQDAAAVRLATSILNSTGGDVSAVPVVWYIGHVPVGAEWDTVPAAPGNVLTPREYQTRWLGVYAQMSGAAEAALLSGSLLTLPAVEPVCRTAILDLPADAESAAPDDAPDDEADAEEAEASGALAGQSDFLLTLTSGFVADDYGRAVLPETDPCDPARQPVTAPAPLPVVPAVGPY